MACSACQKRRKEWQAKQKALQQKKRRAEAAAIGAALAVSEAAGKALGIDGHGEVEDERRTESDAVGGGSGQSIGEGAEQASGSTGSAG